MKVNIVKDRGEDFERFCSDKNISCFSYPKKEGLTYRVGCESVELEEIDMLIEDAVKIDSGALQDVTVKAGTVESIKKSEASSTCKLCGERGKTWKGDNPKCAFKNGKFNDNNWNCATMNELRDIAEKEGLTRRMDMGAGSIGVVPFEGEENAGYIVMTWYKNRGATENAKVMCCGREGDLTEEIALEAIGYQKNGYSSF